MRQKPFVSSLLVLGFWLLIQSSFAGTAKRTILLFSKTAAFRHQSIDAGKKALDKMATEKGFAVRLTEDATQFSESNLKQYNAPLNYSA